MRYVHSRVHVAAALACLAAVPAAAATAVLPLEAGNYVVTTYRPCEGAPNAGVMQFDGKTFFGPHESDCTTSVRDHMNSTWEVAVECHALGDGTPTPATTTVTDLRITSPTHFVRLGQGTHSDYERCPAWH